MTIPIGSRLGPFEVVAPLGAGGMGEVYEAQDTRLGRRVALKVLPEQVAGDPDRRARFEREARAISRLSHPHICALHDFGEAAIDARTVHYLVMEHIEGETIAARFRRGALSIEEVLTAGRQIAEALAAAHRQAIVHRDLKPENVMLTRDGPKLLDFGLARLVEKEPTSDDLKKLPTASCGRVGALTKEGTILGTPPYMAPEQLEGKDADARSDIFSLGALLYEMTTGRAAFTGDTLAGTIAAVIERRPEKVSRLRAQAPAALDHVIERCLAKDPDDRWQSAADIAIELRWAASEEGRSASQTPLRSSSRVAWTVAGVASLALLVSLWSAAWRNSSNLDRGAMRFAIHPPPGAAWSSQVEMHNLALSPDGTRLAFVAKSDGDEEPRLWLRPFDRTAAEPLPGTEGAWSPFWSPDGRWLAFFTHSKLLKVRPGAGPPKEICDAPGENSGCWGPHDTILFAQYFSERDGIFRVDARGGEPRLLIAYDPTVEVEQRWPIFLPDGERFLYHAFRRKDSGDSPPFLCEGDISSGHTRELFRFESRFELASGHLIYVEEGRLLGRPFDVESLQFTGEAFKLGEGLPQFVTGWAPFTASREVIAYRKASSETVRLVWCDREGKELGEACEPGQYSDLALSRDGSMLAFGIGGDGENTDLYIYDLERGVRTRLTEEDGHESCPVWSPDGSQIAYLGHGSFKANVQGGVLVRAIESDVVNPIEQKTLVLPWLTDWSQNDLIACSVWKTETSADIWLLSASEKKEPVLRRGTRFSEEEPAFSPNSRWLAYSSNQSGRFEVYIARVEGKDRGGCVSTGGGLSPRWRSDGKELFYYSPEGVIHAVSIDAVGDVLTPGAPTPLFTAGKIDYFDVTANGERFLVSEKTGTGTNPPIDVIVNWRKGLSTP